jgi:Uma2 family endonuclease
LLPGISWHTYTAILKDIGDSALRLTYDNGLLEIELPGRHHEQIKKLLGTMAEDAMDRLGIAFEPSGSTTWKREAKLKGLEADDCYHIQSIDRVLGKTDLDLTIDPPPDLAIEVEATSPLINKIEVYRSMKIPELWRVRTDGSCDIYLLNAEAAYHPATVSVAIPIITPAILSHYVLLREQLSHGETLRRFEGEVLTNAAS